MTTIGIIGAGNIGRNLSLAVLEVGHDVVIANSRGPETLTSLIEELGPRARAATAAEAAAAGEFAVVAIPLPGTDAVPVEPLAGKVVIDTCNYFPDRYGHVAEIDDGSLTVAGLLQQHLPTSRVVRAFNHIDAGKIPTDGSPAGTPNRRALALAGDDEAARKVVAELYEQLGFDAVDLGTLGESWRLDVNQPTFVVRQNADEMRANAANATRTGESR
ncbi:NADPH-dependent F420 reductase [Streptomyces sp. NPDC094468]|uniref:NADPH-dependent F420 reductase n=1 Tax=Streptomyces sp. NPDC094468 TaxID=3366066 RepID=UPI0037F1DB47